MEKQLNNNQLRFIAEYLAKLPRNATAAYLRVYDCSYDAARVSACELLADPDIRAEVTRREEQLRANLALTAEDVLREIALVATADPRELTENYRGACRHCHGLEFKYQRRPSEFERDLADYLTRNRAAVKKGEAEPDPYGVLFPVLGGVGFSTRAAPNPDCPECDGNGESYEIMKDTRTLSPGAARLYEGVERTREGLKLKIRDRSKALDLAAQHLGVSRKTLEVSGKNGGAIQTASVTFKDVDAQTAASIYQSLVGGS